MAAVMEAFNASFNGSTPFIASIEATIAAVDQELLNNAVSQITWTSTLLTLLAVAVVYDQVSYWRLKSTIVGPAWKLPFMGPFLQSVNPKFPEYLAKWKSGALSCVSVFHKFVVISSERDLSRKIFNSPAFVKPCVVDAAYKLLRPENWVFLDGSAHVAYRKGLNGLFTRQALASYLPGQQEVYEEYFKSFLAASDTVRKNQSGIGEDKAGEKFVYPLRELLTALSCRTFVGHYMSHAQVKAMADDYYYITAALELVNFPIILPFTKSWYGKKAADKVLEVFAACAAKSKIRMKQPGAKAECIVDRWVLQMMDSEKYRERIAKGEDVPAAEKPSQVLRQFSDHEISMTLFTFLFASQDATSSAASWLLQYVADRPEALARVREEGKRVMGDRYGRYEVTLEDLDSMTFTRACVKETLRYRPPVIMVPYLVKKDYPVTPNFTARAGSMIIPSTWLSLHDNEAYGSHGGADTWSPERWIDGDAEEQKSNWLVFGTGPHYCLGQIYAINNLQLLLHLLSANYDFKHYITPKSEDIKVFATIFPMDDLYMMSTVYNISGDHVVYGGAGGAGGGGKKPQGIEKKKASKKGLVCHHCAQRGHKEAECRRKKRGLPPTHGSVAAKREQAAAKEVAADPAVADGSAPGSGPDTSGADGPAPGGESGEASASAHGAE